MKRTLTLLTLLLALLALLVLPAAAADLPRLVDNADLLMADDAEALLADLDCRSEALQFDIVIVTVDSLDGETPRNYAEDFFWYNNYGLGEDRDGALLLVAMDTRDWYIATHGFGITAITPAGREAMVDRFLPQLSNAEYAAAFSTFAEECEDYVNQARNGSAYDTGNLPDEPFEAPGLPVGRGLPAVRRAHRRHHGRRDGRKTQDGAPPARCEQLCCAGQPAPDAAVRSVPLCQHDAHGAPEGQRPQRKRRAFRLRRLVVRRRRGKVLILIPD